MFTGKLGTPASALGNVTLGGWAQQAETVVGVGNSLSLTSVAYLTTTIVDCVNTLLLDQTCNANLSLGLGLGMREQFANTATSTLDGGINDSVTSLDVNDASSFPTSGNFRILIDDEILLVTGVSSATFTVVRGAEGTTPDSHSSAAPVTHVLTAGSIVQHGADNLPFFNDSSRPPMRILDASGDALVASDFIWVNQGTASRADGANGEINLTIPATGTTSNFRRLLARTQPSTPYDITMAIMPSLVGTSPTAQMGFLNAGSGAIWYIYLGQLGVGLVAGVQVAATALGSPTNKLAGTRIGVPSEPLWMKIEHDGTNLAAMVSGNGITWVEIFTEAAATHFGGNLPTHVWWGGEAFTNTFDQTLSLVHWQE